MLSPGLSPRAFFAKMSGNTLSKSDLRSNSPAAFLRCRGPVDGGVCHTSAGQLALAI